MTEEFLVAGLEQQGPVAEVQGPEAEVQGPEAEVQGNVAEVQGPVAEVVQGPVAEVQGPVAEVHWYRGRSSPSVPISGRFLCLILNVHHHRYGLNNQ